MTVEMSNLAQINDAKSTQGVFTLPCGFLDAEGNLHTEVVIRELTGEEEDLLSSKTLSAFHKYNELLVRCTQRLGSITDRGQLSAAIKSLPVGDRVFLLFAIRRVSIGDEYLIEATCNSCQAKHNYTVLLSELEVRPMPDPKKRIHDITLPSGATARFRISTGVDEERSMKLDKSEDALSRAMHMRLELLNGQPPELKDVRAMKWRDRRALREAWNKVEGGVDTEVSIDCASCGVEFKRDVEVSGSFFFPSEASKT